MTTLLTFLAATCALTAHGSPTPIGTAFDWDVSPAPWILKNLANAGRGDGLRIFWWNVHDGRTDSKIPDFTLSKNVVKLVHSEFAPDVLAFAEYQESDLSADDLTEVRRLYPFQLQQPYPGTPGFGLAVYSRYPFQISSIDVLDFTPLTDMSDVDREQYRKLWCGTSGICGRPMVILQLNVNGKNLKLVPIHLYDCWRKLKENIGIIRTAEQVFFGTHNPLWFQINRFRSMLEARLGNELTRGNVVVIGDFNMPKEILGVTTRGYRKISWGLTDAVPGDSPTIPSRNSPEARHFPSMAIDHAFVSPSIEVQEGDVLPLRGSDHYPVYVVVSTP